MNRILHSKSPDSGPNADLRWSDFTTYKTEVAHSAAWDSDGRVAWCSVAPATRRSGILSRVWLRACGRGTRAPLV